MAALEALNARANFCSDSCRRETSRLEPKMAFLPFQTPQPTRVSTGMRRPFLVMRGRGQTSSVPASISPTIRSASSRTSGGCASSTDLPMSSPGSYSRRASALVARIVPHSSSTQSMSVASEKNASRLRIDSAARSCARIRSVTSYPDANSRSPENPTFHSMLRYPPFACRVRQVNSTALRPSRALRNSGATPSRSSGCTRSMSGTPIRSAGSWPSVRCHAGFARSARPSLPTMQKRSVLESKKASVTAGSRDCMAAPAWHES